MLLTLIVLTTPSTAAMITTPPLDRYALFDRPVPPSGWSIDHRAHANTIFGRVDVPLAHPAEGLTALRAKAARIADPTDESYGAFLSKTEILQMLHPEPETVTAVEGWLQRCDAHLLVDKSGVDVWRLPNVTVGKVECLFETQIMQCRSHTSAKLHLAAIGPVSLPASLSPFVPFVPSLSDFPLPKKLGRRHNATAEGAVDKGVVAPKTIANLYDIQDKLFPAAGATLAIAELDIGGTPSSYTPSYLFGGKGDPGFFSLAGVAAHEVSSAAVVGPFKPDDGELEANLDMQFGASTARGAKLVYWTEERWMYELATGVFNGEGGVSAKDVDVLSISYAWSEAHQCLQPTGKPNPTCTEHKILTPAYVERVNTEFAKLGAAGTTVVVSSGDDGAPGNFGKCDGKLLDPLFPAASPYVLTVGGTMLARGPKPGQEEETTSVEQQPAADPICTDNKGCATSTSEVACSYPGSGITSGGGFSVYAARPSFQDAAVSAYLSRKGSLPSPHLFNSSNRGYPDVAAVANNFAVYSGSILAATSAAPKYRFWIPTDGTSAAAPVVAGILALVKANLGKRLGLVAPTLYHLAKEEPAVFKDITQGANACRSDCCAKGAKGEGYGATVGWDAVTGLGTLNAKQLLAALGRLHGVEGEGA